MNVKKTRIASLAGSANVTIKQSQNDERVGRARSKIENKLLEDIREIERLVTFRYGALAKKPEAQWERNALLSSDRNDLIRIGVNKAFSEVEFFMEAIIVDYFIDRKKHSSKTKKYQLFEKTLKVMDFSSKRTLLSEIVPLPPSINRFLKEVEVLKENASRKLSEMESGTGCRYHGRSIFDLRAFKYFCQDAEKASGHLMDQFVKTS